MLVLAEPVLDKRVNARDLGVRVHDRAGPCVRHGGRGLLAGDLDVLGVGGLDRNSRDHRGIAHAAVGEPAGQTAPPDAPRQRV